MPIKKRNTDEFILLAICASAAMAVLPFTVIRFIAQDWLIFAIDCAVVFTMVTLFVYIMRTHKVNIAKFVIAALLMVGINATVYIKGIPQLYWSFPAMVSLYFFLSAEIAAFFAVVGAIILLPVTSFLLASFEFFTFVITVVTTNFFAYLFSIHREKQQDELIKLTQKDPLTGTGNRRALDEKLSEVIYLNKRTQLTACLIMIDIDKFKHINDQFGHDVGDHALKAVCKLINHRVRFSDSLFRFGGEEFIVVAEATNLQEAMIMAEQLRVEVETNRLVKDEVITISIGVAEIQLGETQAEWIKRADLALLQAKKQGRNVVCMAPNNEIKRQQA